MLGQVLGADPNPDERKTVQPEEVARRRLRSFRTRGRIQTPGSERKSISSMVASCEFRGDDIGCRSGNLVTGRARTMNLLGSCRQDGRLFLLRSSSILVEMCWQRMDMMRNCRIGKKHRQAPRNPLVWRPLTICVVWPRLGFLNSDFACKKPQVRGGSDMLGAMTGSDNATRNDACFADWSPLVATLNSVSPSSSIATRSPGVDSAEHDLFSEVLVAVRGDPAWFG